MSWEPRESDWSNPEHHPKCPLYGLEHVVNVCLCLPCEECEGSGCVLISTAQAGDQTFEEWVDCGLCDGAGRVLS